MTKQSHEFQKVVGLPRPFGTLSVPSDLAMTFVYNFKY